MNTLCKKSLFVFSMLSFGTFCLPSEGLAMHEEEEEREKDVNSNIIRNKENNPKEESANKENDFLTRIKNLPKESLEKKKGGKLSVDIRKREDKLWVNEKGEKVIIENK